MKRTLSIITIILTALLLLLASCNSDASAGLFRQLADSKEPVGIKYMQILGRTGAPADTLYFLTNDGIYSKKDNESTKSVKKSEKPILTAALNGNKITYVVNKDSGQGGLDIWQVNTDGSANEKMADPTLITFESITSYKLLPNGNFIVNGKKGGNYTFTLASYDSNTNQFTEIVTIDTGADEYALQDAVLLNGQESEAINKAIPIPLILILVKDGKYLNYYIDGNDAFKITFNSATELISSMALGLGKLYMLTTNGVLHSSPIPTKHNEVITEESAKYKDNIQDSFLISIPDGLKVHLIAKSSNTSYGFVVYTDDGASISSNIFSDGFAKYMKNIQIVSSLKKEANKYLIATFKNGMFEITITDAENGNGSSSGPEAYLVQ